MATRQSFAFDPARASQGAAQSAPAAGKNTPQVVGGQVQADVVSGMSFSSPGPMANQFGAFLEDAMRPYVERKAKENFIRGVTDQMSAVAGEEIRASNGGFNKIFGPSSYEEGAVFYGAKKAVSDWATSNLNDMDNLKRLTPEALQQHMVASMQGLETGDRFTDLAIQTSMIETMPQVIGVVAKERYKFGQETARQNYAASVDSSSGLYQNVIERAASLTDPTDEDRFMVEQAKGAFIASLQKPVNMDEDSWAASLMSMYRNTAQQGRGHALAALKETGFLNALPEEQRVRLDDVELRYGTRALEAAAADPEISDMVTELDAMIISGNISATDAMAYGRAINSRVKAVTGFDLDLMDYKNITGIGKTVFTGIKAAADERRRRQEAIDDIYLRHGLEMERDAAERQADAVEAQAIYSSGNVAGGIRDGLIKESQAEMLANEDYQRGNFTPLVKVYETGGHVFKGVASEMQNKIKSSLGTQYSKAFGAANKEFTTLNKRSPSMAKEYYGKDLYLRMLNFNKLQGSGGPQWAYAQAFENFQQYTEGSLAPDQRKSGTEAINGAIESQNGMFGGIVAGRDNLSPSSMSKLSRMLGAEVALEANNSGRDINLIAKEVLNDRIRTGRIERYGKFIIPNGGGERTFARILGLKTEQADAVIGASINEMFSRSGLKDTDEVDLMRIVDEQGNPAILGRGSDGKGGTVSTVITMNYLKKVADRYMKRKAGDANGTNYTGRLIDPTSGKPIPSGSIPDVLNRVGMWPNGTGRPGSQQGQAGVVGEDSFLGAYGRARSNSTK